MTLSQEFLHCRISILTRRRPKTDARVCLAEASPVVLWKGGGPAAGSPTATLLRLSPDHQARRGRQPPEG